jgi:hypothetical protein
MRRQAIIEKTDTNANSESKLIGRKKRLSTAKSFISPAPILNLKINGALIRVSRAVAG